MCQLLHKFEKKSVYLLPCYTSKPAETFVNKHMPIVNENDLDCYNLLFRFSPVRVHTWVMTEFFRLAMHKDESFQLRPGHANVSQVLKEAVQQTFSSITTKCARKY